MEELPNELVQLIALNLDVEDVKSCSLVSLRWRNALNVNDIWSRLYVKSFGLREHPKLQIECCKVVPKFSLPKIQGRRLTELCDWRKKYLKRLHVAENWKNGNYLLTTLLKEMKNLEFDYDDDMLVIFDPSPSAYFQVYDLQNYSLVQDKTYCSLSGPGILKCKINKGVLVIIQDLLVQVYKTTKNNVFLLTYRFIQNCPDECVDFPDITCSDISQWYITFMFLRQETQRMSIVQSNFNDKYFVSIINNKILQVWDMESKEKIMDCKPFCFEFSHVIIMGVKKVQICLRFVTEFESDEEEDQHTIRVFDLTKREVLPWCIDISCRCHIHFEEGRIFTIQENNELDIWSSSTGQNVLRILETLPPEADCIYNCLFPLFKYEYPYFVFAHDQFSSIYVYNILQENVFTFKVGQVFCMFISLPYLILITHKPDNRNRLEVWDLSEQDSAYRLQKFNVANVKTIKSSISKLIMETQDEWGIPSELQILDFW